MTWERFQFCFLVLCTLGWIGSLIRLQQTSESHPDWKARREVCYLSVLLLISSGLVVLRERFPNPSLGYWLLNLCLLPAVVGIVMKVLHLLRQYRHDSL